MNVFETMATISLDTSKYDKGIKDSQSKMKNVATTLGSGIKTAAKVGATAIGVTTTAIMGFTGKAVQTGANFDKSMAQVAATMGKTTDEIQDLRDFAQKMGSTTAFSASQAADALNYMALAGYDSKKSMSMLPNVLNLASAGNMELATASDMVTDAQSALGLSMKETEGLVDKMAKASSKTNTSVSQLGQGILTVGGTAKNLKGGTTELAQALGLLADNGVKGAEGGTALRNILLNLTPKSDKAADAFEKLGLNAYDADGKMRPLQDIFADLNKGLEGMSDKEKTSTLAAIFNKVDLKSVNALLATSTERWDEVSDAIDKSKGAASQMAETQLDNLQGDITLLKSAWEGLQIGISDNVTPALREFVQFATKGVEEITTAIKKGGITEAFSKIGDFLADAITKIVSKIPSFVEAGAEILKSLISGITENAPSIMESAKSIFDFFINSIQEGYPQLLNFGMQLLLKITEGISQNLEPLLTTAISIITQLINSLVAQLPAIINVGLQLIQVLADGIIKALPNLIAQLPTIINGIINALLSAIPMIIETGVKLLTSLAENLPTIIDSLVNSIDSIIDNLIDALIDNAPLIAEAGVKLFIALLKNLPKIIVSLLKGVQTLTKKIFDKFIEKAPAMASTGLKLLGSLFNKLPEILTLASQGMKDILDAIVNTFNSNPLVEVGKNLIKGLWNGINDMKDWVIGLVKGFAKGIIDNIEKIFGINSPSKVFAEIGGFLAQGLGVGWEDAISDVKKAIEGDLNFDVGKLSSDIETSIKTTTEDGYYNLNDVYRTMNKILEQIEVNGANTVSAIENTDTSIVLNDREFGRAVRKVYA